MNRPSTVSKCVRVFVTAAALAVGALGCGGGNDSTGGAGSAGGTGGAGGAGGTSCDPLTIFAETKHGCTTAAACHDANGAAAGFDMVTAGWQNKLVGAMAGAKSTASTPFPSVCGGMGRVYLTAGSSPATGLFLDKINPDSPTPPCGMHMPELYTALSTTEFACVQTWANGLVNAAK